MQEEGVDYRDRFGSPGLIHLEPPGEYLGFPAALRHVRVLGLG
jgi:hypothetical protein